MLDRSRDRWLCSDAAGDEGCSKVRECTYGVIWLPFVDALAMAMALGVSLRATALLGLGYAIGAVIPCPLPLQQ